MSFGEKGEVTVDIDRSNFVEVHELTVQDDGTLVIVGESNKLDVTNIAVAKVNADGSRDESFGLHGGVVTGIDFIDIAHTVDTLNDDHIVVGGQVGYVTKSDVFIFSYDKQGNFAADFGNKGKVVIDMGSDYENISSLKVMKNGEIIAGGTSGGNIFLLQLAAQ